MLADRDPAGRREAAIALGTIGDRRAIVPLLGVLAESDRFAAWSVQTAIRRLGYPVEAALRAALLDPRRRRRLDSGRRVVVGARRPSARRIFAADARARLSRPDRRQPGEPVSHNPRMVGNLVGA